MLPGAPEIGTKSIHIMKCQKTEQLLSKTALSINQQPVREEAKPDNMSEFWLTFLFAPSPPPQSLSGSAYERRQTAGRRSFVTDGSGSDPAVVPGLTMRER